jgi:hypothetical protein
MPRILQQIFALPRLLKLITINNTDTLQQRLPRGFYIGVRKSYKSKEWGIGIWFVSPGEPLTGRQQLSWIKEHLTDATRLKILHIKHAISTRPEYKRKEIASTDIYQAVLEHNVTTLDQFLSYVTTRCNATVGNVTPKSGFLSWPIDGPTCQGHCRSPPLGTQAALAGARPGKRRQQRGISRVEDSGHFEPWTCEDRSSLPRHGLRRATPL